MTFLLLNSRNLAPIGLCPWLHDKRLAGEEERFSLFSGAIESEKQ